MQPRAIGKEALVRRPDGLLGVEIVEAGREYVLDPFAELIWDLSDGSRTIEMLARGASQFLNRTVQREEVFSTLDFLADAGLIEQRVAPPAAEINVSRRALLARIVPVASAAAWMVNERSAKAGISQDREGDSKESNRKADAREANSKEGNRKADRKEDDRKEDDRKQNLQRANDDASKEQNRKAENHKESDHKSDLRRQKREESSKEDDPNLPGKQGDSEDIIELKMRISWPKVYDIVGHTLSEFPDLADAWKTARASVLRDQTLAPGNYKQLFGRIAKEFESQLESSTMARIRFGLAGFRLPGFLDTDLGSPVLDGDNNGKTRLVLDYVANPAIGANWRLALAPSNLRIVFQDQNAAYEFLSNKP